MTVVASVSVVGRFTRNEPWVESSIAASIAVSVFSISAAVWLTSNIFSTGIDALVDRLHMRKHAFHSESLLRGGFPPPVARALLRGVPAKDLCRQVESASIAFINLSDYDAIIDKFATQPKGLVHTQDVIWTALDSLLEAFPGAEKVETVGSVYLVAAGLVEPNPRHAEILAHFCLHVLEVCKDVCGQQVAISIGVSNGCRRRAREAGGNVPGAKPHRATRSHTPAPLPLPRSFTAGRSPVASSDARARSTACTARR